MNTGISSQVAFRREERRSEGKREETVGLKRAYVNAFIIT